MAQAKADPDREQAFVQEFVWTKEAGTYLLGSGLRPVPSEEFVAISDRNNDGNFKAIQQRKLPDDPTVSQEGGTIMGAAMVVWSSTIVSAFRVVGWAEIP
jgi:hypothetical protein